MPRRVFFSFHYDADNWRASQVRNIGAVDGNPAASDNDWESVTRGGDAAIKRWIAGQMYGRTCAVVLIGANTANRKWINFEISESWNQGLGVVGIHVHRLKDRNQQQSAKGLNPFDYVSFTKSGAALSVIPTHDPPFWDSRDVYGHIGANIADWIEEAVALRAVY